MLPSLVKKKQKEKMFTIILGSKIGVYFFCSCPSLYRGRSHFLVFLDANSYFTHDVREISVKEKG